MYCEATIFKDQSFERTGTVLTKTYRKPGCQPQYLPYASEHSFKCRAAIFKGEAIRHLVNCSKQSDYDCNILHLQNALKKRGYPSSLLPHIPYNLEERKERIRTLGQRRRDPQENRGAHDSLVFKCPYGTHLRELELHKECKKLLTECKAYLPSVRLIIAHPVRSNIFLRTFRYNHPPRLASWSMERG